MLDLRQNLRWPRSIFQIMWSKVHESTEKTLTGKGQFLPGSDLTIRVSWDGRGGRNGRFDLFVDASDQTVGGDLTQTYQIGVKNPVAFCSIKLNDTQRRWSTIEREAFAALSSAEIGPIAVGYLVSKSPYILTKTPCYI